MSERTWLPALPAVESREVGRAEPVAGGSPPVMDALLPREMAIRAEDLGVKKAAAPPATVLALAVLAGAFIALGGVFSTTVTAGAAGALPFGVTRLLGGVAFALGLMLVLVGGAELFTGNNLLVMACMSGKVSVRRLLTNWGLVYAGNFVGAVATAALVVASGHHELGDGVVGATLRATAEAKLALGFRQALLLGVLCNALVCLAVWLSYSARSTTDRVLAVVPPVAAFVAAGFEHSVANMYFVPAAMFAGLGDLDWWRFVTRNLIPVTLGNIVGGSVLVGAMYWFVYLRGGRR